MVQNTYLGAHRRSCRQWGALSLPGFPLVTSPRRFPPPWTVENLPKSDLGHRWALPISARVSAAGVGDVRGSAMDANAARTRDLIGSALLFAFAILIILAFGFL
jgi:hypothetical protein